MIPEENSIVSNSSVMDWDVPPEVQDNGYIQNSIPHSNSVHLSDNASESCRKSDYFLKGFPNMTSMKKSFSINSALSHRAKDSFWGARHNSIGNSLSFYNISSIFSPQDSV